MSGIATVKVENTATTSSSPTGKSPALTGKDTVQLHSVETDEAQSRDGDNGAQVIVPVQFDLKAPDRLTIESYKPSSLPDRRPIDPTNLEIRETVNMAGMRPIGSSELHVAQMYNMSGLRPIGSSDLHVSQTMSVLGNRPVASNDSDDTESFMGYLD